MHVDTFRVIFHVKVKQIEYLRVSFINPDKVKVCKYLYPNNKEGPD